MKQTDNWNVLSALLMDTDEISHLNVDIIIETNEDMGLSSLDKLRITEIWQHPIEGIISFKIEGNSNVFELEEDSELISQIINYLNNGSNY